MEIMNAYLSLSLNIIHPVPGSKAASGSPIGALGRGGGRGAPEGGGGGGGGRIPPGGGGGGGGGGGILFNFSEIMKMKSTDLKN